MAISAIICAALLALGGPDWAIVDLPYPDVRPGGKPTPEEEVAEAVAEHVRARDPKRPATRRLLLSNLKIDGPRAWVRVTDGDRTETVWLTLKDGAWKVEK